MRCALCSCTVLCCVLPCCAVHAHGGSRHPGAADIRDCAAQLGQGRNPPPGQALQDLVVGTGQLHSTLVGTAVDTQSALRFGIGQRGVIHPLVRCYRIWWWVLLLIPDTRAAARRSCGSTTCTGCCCKQLHSAHKSAARLTTACSVVVSAAGRTAPHDQHLQSQTCMRTALF